jgi:hypothetical protein
VGWSRKKGNIHFPSGVPGGGFLPQSFCGSGEIRLRAFFPVEERIEDMFQEKVVERTLNRQKHFPNLT